MAIRNRKLRNGKTSYDVSFYVNGRQVWEHAGYNERAALSLEAQRKREVRDGTYSPHAQRRALSVRTWLDRYFHGRSNRTRDNDIGLVKLNVLSIEWFASMQVTAARPLDALRVTETMRAAGSLGEKSIATVYGLVQGAFARAVIEEIIADNPFQLARAAAKLKTKTSGANKRHPYSRDDARKLTSDESVLLDIRVWLALAFYAGMREGEICGRRWRDWQRD